LNPPLYAALRSSAADQWLFCAEQSVGHRQQSLRTVTEIFLSTDTFSPAATF